MINNLTGLRFFMAFWVVYYHASGPFENSFLMPVIENGYLGVDVFFVLSGYILTHVYYDKFFIEKNNLQAGWTFIKRRFARIYPLHLATLLGAIVYMTTMRKLVGAYEYMPFDQIWKHATLIHAWGTIDGLISWNFPSWSVSAEWFAYLVIFPLAHLSYRLLKLNGFILFALTIFIGYALLTFYYFNNNVGSQLTTGALRIIPEFLLGAASYISFQKGSKNARILLIALWTVTAIVLTYTLDNYQYAFILAVSMILVLLQKGNKILNVIFGHKIIVYLGEISYSIYMVHFFSRAITGIVANNISIVQNSAVLFVMIYTLLTLVFSYLTYNLIEVPARSFINNFKLTKS